MTAASEGKFIVSMLNLTQGISVQVKHVFLISTNYLTIRRTWSLSIQKFYKLGKGQGAKGKGQRARGKGEKKDPCFYLFPFPFPQGVATSYGSTQRPSALIRLINSSTPLSSGTFLISSLPRYKEI
ncbi:hypothetical protein NSTC745_02077 [Nostoc sp. DSM 114161]|jgi:hypothetical protein